MKKRVLSSLALRRREAKTIEKDTYNMQAKKTLKPDSKEINIQEMAGPSCPDKYKVCMG